MRERPLVGITTQTLQAIHGIPGDLPRSAVMNQRYYLAAAAAGAVPVLIPLIPDDIGTLREIYDRLDGLLLPGGVDIGPATYGEAAHEKLGTVDDARDRTELQMTAWAIEDGTPVLGVCRGVQLLNVACGGSLYQDIEATVAGAGKHDYFPEQGYRRDYLAHDVNVERGSRLHAIVQRDALQVNSLHHQAIHALGAGLRISATSPDGIVEGVEGEGEAYVVGVQWHPEAFEQPDPATAALFASFVEACRAG